MSKAKVAPSKKTFLYAELRADAFASPDHEYTLADIRRAVYANRGGEPFKPEFAAHLSTCEHCQHEIALLQKIDPLLNGEDERLKVLIHAAQDSNAAKEIEARGGKAISAVGKGVAMAAAAAAIVGSFFARREKEEQPKKREQEGNQAQSAS